ncbi:hypothetical protein JAAARDRAFT_39885 [Jaapia argillacea MUCL 33604]|uniref:Uncharacterized protein n=1 Tax=Jaapia argillacea MUCL 33604 TaxID=933084 RepID=A0A067PQP2_9AGAM|nr:hypothetical protein JAAARDRAFT_39885 [Jaapia argillacea MUCL 33604]
MSGRTAYRPQPPLPQQASYRPGHMPAAGYPPKQVHMPAPEHAPMQTPDAPDHPPGVQEAPNASRSWINVFAALSVIALFGANIAFSAVFSASRGDIFLLSFSTAFFVASFATSSSAALFLTSEDISVSQQWPRVILRWMAYVSGLFSLLGFEFLCAAVLFLGVNYKPSTGFTVEDMGGGFGVEFLAIVTISLSVLIPLFSFFLWMGSKTPSRDAPDYMRPLH